jgi:MOSC domain-containing protein YiiM
MKPDRIRNRRPETPVSRVVHIFYKPAHLPARPAGRYTREPLAEANLIADHGIDRDVKGGKPDRHVNLMSAETLARLAEAGLRTEDGQLGEQVVVAGVEVERLRPGDRLFLGADACLEVVQPRTGCRRLQEVQGQPLTATSGRLGVMTRVLAGGVVRVGDAVRVQAKEP